MSSSDPEQVRHKPPAKLDRPRELLLVCPAFKSQVNLSRIVRLAGCAGVTQMIVCGNAKVDPVIARDGINQVEIQKKRTLLPVIKKLRADGFRLVGLEQTKRSVSIHDFSFERKTALVIGHEKWGMKEDEIPLMHDLLEIPVWGLPYSYNVATATTMAVYEYCRQFPHG